MHKLDKNRAFLLILLISCMQNVSAEEQITIVDDNQIVNEFVTTPLHELVLQQFPESEKELKLEKIQQLLDAGLHVNARNENRRTPLWLVTFYGGDIEIISLLIRYGADVTIPDMFNETPLHNAVTRNDTIVANMLLDAGAVMKPHTVERMIAFKDDAEHSSFDMIQTDEMENLLTHELQDALDREKKKDIV